MDPKILSLIFYMLINMIQNRLFSLNINCGYNTTTKIQNNDVWFLDTFKKLHYLDYNVIFNGAY